MHGLNPDALVRLVQSQSDLCRRLKDVVLRQASALPSGQGAWRLDDSWFDPVPSFRLQPAQLDGRLGSAAGLDARQVGQRRACSWLKQTLVVGGSAAAGRAIGPWPVSSLPALHWFPPPAIGQQQRADHHPSLD